VRLLILLFLFSLSSHATFSQKEQYLADLRAKIAVVKDTMLANALNGMGAFFLDENNYDSSGFYLQKALSLSEKIRYPRGIYTSLGNIGVIEYRNSRLLPALEYYQRALEAAEGNNDERMAAITLSNIGELNIVIGNTGLGIKQLLQSAAKLEEFKDTLTLISVHIRISLVYADLKEKEKSSSFLEKAMQQCRLKLSAANLKLNEKVILKVYMRHILFNQSIQLKEQGELGKSLAILKQLSQEMKDIGGGREKIYYEYQIAVIYFEMEKHREALEYCNSTLALLKTTDSIPDIFADLYELRAGIYEQSGMTATALADLKMSKKIREGIFNDEMLSKTQALIAKQAADQKNREITYLTKEKLTYKWLVAIAGIAVLVAGLALFLILRSRKLQKKLLTQKSQITLNEKELENNRLQIQLFELEQSALRAQMNPHFIFNSLNSIQHYVINQDIQGANKYISMLGSLIRLTLEYASKKEILLAEELLYIEKYINLEKMRMQDKFDYSITVDEAVHPDYVSIPPMLLQPFIENAIKHGVKYLEDKKGEIDIAVLPVKGGLKYLVTDNGIGREVTARYKTSVTNGHQSKGINLSEMRVALLKNQDVNPTIEIIDLKDAAGNACGTQVIIILPG
jgi:sensor histidine kinase YesM